LYRNNKRGALIIRAEIKPIEPVQVMLKRENEPSFHFYISFLSEFIESLRYCRDSTFSQWGALLIRAEIIPTEPDPGNAGVGMAMIDNRLIV